METDKPLWEYLHRINIEGGHIELNKATGKFEILYHLTDHLGNVRAELSTDGSIKRHTSYYPFGMEWDESSDIEYAYNGKEKQEMHGFNMYDYGARFYDQTIGRWHSMDPLAEKYYSISPYAYCANNPVKNIDPDGRDWYSYIDKDDKTQYVYNPDIHSQKELDKNVGNAKYLGKTFTEGNNYYSLFGSIVNISSLEGQLYVLIDKAIMKEAKEIIDNPNNMDFQRTNFSIEGMKTKNSRMLGFDTYRNQYPFNYEGSFDGAYRIYDGPGMMIGQQEEWIGRSDMPKDIGAWSVGKVAYHIIYRNKGGSDIIHLRYNNKEAQSILQKYYKLYPQLKK